ncbi:MAG: hypothetical protein AAFM92_12405 [Pseudomonadota bacterium]
MLTVVALCLYVVPRLTEHRIVRRVSAYFSFARSTDAVLRTQMRVTLPLSFGARSMGTLAAALLLYALNLHSSGPVGSPLPPEYFWESYTIASGLMAWFMSYIWTYAIALDGNKLSVPTWNFGSREHDIRHLVRVEASGGFCLRLWFSNGAKAAILKPLRGRAELLQRLEAQAARGGVL